MPEVELQKMQGYAGAIIFNPAIGKVLVHKRDDKAPVNPNLWGLFGGRIELEETPVTALARELKEELGITITPASIQPLLDYPTNHGTHHNAFIVTTRLSSSDMVLGEGEGFGWFTIDEALALDLTTSTRKDLDFFKNFLKN